MAFIDFRTPAAGFDQPLALWLACHERVVRMTVLLERLAEHIAEKGVDEAAGVTATSILRYFDEAAPRHHDDEEVDLFPRLRRRMQRKAGVVAVRAAIERLEIDHREMRPLWERLRETLQAIVRGEAVRLDAQTVRQFVGRYRSHVQVEDTVLAPALDRYLTKRDLDAVGQAMAKRRGADWKQLHAGHLARDKS